MEHSPSSNWRARFEQDRASSPKPTNHTQGSVSSYDDGHQPARHGLPPASPRAVADEAAMELAEMSGEYRPWILQRGARPALMLHLRRFDPRSKKWTGWAVSYPHLVALDYVGEEQLALDFGARHFLLQGHRLGELVSHLQTGTVACIQEFTSEVWNAKPPSPAILRIRPIGQQADET